MMIHNIMPKQHALRL